MKKQTIIKKLKTLSLDKKDYIVIGGAALVLHGIIEETEDIDLSCTSEVYSKLDWDITMGYFNKEIKYYDNFEISPNFFDMERVEVISSFQVASLEACYDLKKLENKRKDKKVIEKLDFILCSKDSYRYERSLREQGASFIAGVDEVGRGPLVGPVVAACVVLPEKFNLEGLTDSKKLSEKKRNFYYEEIKKQALGIGIGIISEQTIDQVNIYEATKMAMREAIKNCQKQTNIEHILIDAMPLDLEIPTTSIIKGDMKSITISAASVIAKVTRDQMMYELDEKYPMYDFKQNKGYPTKKHIEAIKKYGVLKEHRRTFGPVAEVLQKSVKK